MLVHVASLHGAGYPLVYLGGCSTPGHVSRIRRVPSVQLDPGWSNQASVSTCPKVLLRLEFMNPREIVNRFRQWASKEAWELAKLLSACPQVTETTMCQILEKAKIENRYHFHGSPVEQILKSRLVDQNAFGAWYFRDGVRRELAGRVYSHERAAVRQIFR